MTQRAHRTMTQRTAGAPPATARVRRERQAPAAAEIPLARVLAGLLFLAGVALASLPQARAVSATFGWVPLWLLLVPASAWLALRLRPARYGPDAARAYGTGAALRSTRAPQRAYVRGNTQALPAMTTTRRPRAPRISRATGTAPAPL